ncbi:MAG: AarF/ABC1/UbiB kinase family protein [Crocinitomicaceae bacterium]|nr:AarF/UbiB family protein [Flavobacteriales bacterium]NQZ35914.1 AarF/ABC1/UbiB kinase family protein [Crocinitomicaceae bacterium]
MKSRISIRKRSKKAYRLTNQLLFSYLFLFLGKKVFGNRYYEKRIDAVHTKNAKRVKSTISELQGLFTKAGQLLSTLSHILPEQYTRALESLQDDAPTSPFEETKALIEKELNGTIDTLFESFETVPIASASIGQVYRAKLNSGEHVAVKVQHSNIEELAKADLVIIEKLIKRVSHFVKIQGIEHVYSQVKIMIEEELDYEKEAISMNTISANIAEIEGVMIPEVFASHSTQRILTTRFEVGTKITNISQLDEWKIDRKALGEKFILVYLKMILENGLYHADPHPGNLLVNKEGVLIILDFGAVSRLSDGMRNEIPVLLQAILRKDEAKILASLRKLGFIGSDAESSKVAKKLIGALSQFLQNEVKFDSMNIKDISMDDIKGSSIDNLRKEIGLKELTKIIRIPKEWILLDRTFQLLIGTSSTLAPEMNPMDVIRPYMKKLITEDGGVQKMILDAIKQQFMALLQLPGELSLFLTKANQGEMEVNIRNSGDRSYALGQQFIYLFIGISSFFAYHFIGSTIYIITAIAMCTMLLRSMWINRRI